MSNLSQRLPDRRPDWEPRPPNYYLDHFYGPWIPWIAFFWFLVVFGGIGLAISYG